jgi:hypothetical protein
MRSWWISGFYSLCIQSFVRRALVQLLVDNPPEDSTVGCLGAQRFLHLAVRLFAASSRTYDPLTREPPQDCGPSCTEEELWRVNETRFAQVAVKQATWSASGIKSSGEYLKRIFEDDGENIPSPPSKNSSGQCDYGNVSELRKLLGNRKLSPGTALQSPMFAPSGEASRKGTPDQHLANIGACCDSKRTEASEEKHNVDL